MYQSYFINLTNLSVRLCHKLHAHLLLAFEHSGRQFVGFIFELGDAVLTCVIDGLYEYIIHKDVELMRLPFTHTPVFQTQA